MAFHSYLLYYQTRAENFFSDKKALFELKMLLVFVDLSARPSPVFTVRERYTSKHQPHQETLLHTQLGILGTYYIQGEPEFSITQYWAQYQDNNIMNLVLMKWVTLY